MVASDVTQGGAAGPAVSIIVPVYNVAEHVGAAIESLRRQTFEDFEAIIVDDGSTDDSHLRACQAAAGDSRFRFVRQANAGLSAARNAGLRNARASIIGFLDSDDTLAPEFLAKLMDVLRVSRADWAACAVEIVSPERTHVASAIHGQAHPATDEPWRVFQLDDWAEIVRHWPSAWNKLYRRELIEGLRFPQSLSFEDHDWFRQVAERAYTLAYLPEPLYRHTRGRVGQITNDPSDRVYDQFAILRRVGSGLAASSKRNARDGFARLVTRTLHERSATQRDPQRRARFIDASRRFLDTNGLGWTPAWDRSVSHSFGDVLAGRLPLSVVIATDGAGPGLARTLESIANQYLVDLEVIVAATQTGLDAYQRLEHAAGGLPSAWVSYGGTGCVAEARNRGLSQAKGLFSVVLDAGDTLAPGALWLWVEAMIRERADLGISRFSQAAGHVHPSTHDGRDPFGRPWPKEADPNDRDWLAEIEGRAGRIPPDRAPLLHAHPSAKIFRTAFLRARGLCFAPEPFGSWGFSITAALQATRAVAIPPVGLHVSDAAVDRRLWRRSCGVAEIDAALSALAPVLDAHMPRKDWYPRLIARALWEKTSFGDFPNGAKKTAFWADARALVARTCPELDPETRIDSFISPEVRLLFPAHRGAMAYQHG
ncbi:MAG: glycosyltransferase [Pseudomonadota bacterium]